MSGVPTDDEYLDALCDTGHAVACDPGPSWFDVIPWGWVGVAVLVLVALFVFDWGRTAWRRR